MKLNLNSSWSVKLEQEFSKPYFKQLMNFLDAEISKGETLFPSTDKIFAAFELTFFEDVKVVIIGQDPYHGAGQANGLSFSVNNGIRKPPSLLNIFKELNSDLQIPLPQHGNLDSWAKQGVLLLNTTLTVKSGLPGSHQKKGWEIFTDAVISKISTDLSGIVFLLWGNFAQSKIPLIDAKKHFILTAAHPSPLARTGFEGCRHFSKTNTILESIGKQPVSWGKDLC